MGRYANRNKSNNISELLSGTAAAAHIGDGNSRDLFSNKSRSKLSRNKQDRDEIGSRAVRKEFHNNSPEWFRIYHRTEVTEPGCPSAK